MEVLAKSNAREKSRMLNSSCRWMQRQYQDDETYVDGKMHSARVSTSREEGAAFPDHAIMKAQIPTCEHPRESVVICPRLSVG